MKPASLHRSTAARSRLPGRRLRPAELGTMRGAQLLSKKIFRRVARSSSRLGGRPCTSITHSSCSCSFSPAGGSPATSEQSTAKLSSPTQSCQHACCCDVIDDASDRDALAAWSWQLACARCALLAIRDKAHPLSCLTLPERAVNQHLLSSLPMLDCPSFAAQQNTTVVKLTRLCPPGLTGMPVSS